MQKLTKFRRFLKAKAAKVACGRAGAATEKYYELYSNARILPVHAALLCSRLTWKVVLLDARVLAKCSGIDEAVHLSRNSTGQLLVIGAASPTQGQTATQQQSEEK